MTANREDTVAGRIAIVIGAIASLAFVLVAGRHNQSVLVKIIMAAWVVSPFALLAVAARRSRQWVGPARGLFQRIVFIVVAGELVVYTVNAWIPLSSKAAPPFVITPPVCWVAIALGWLIARSNRNARQP